MPMPLKDPRTRRRRNVSTTRRTLYLVANRPVPDLPAREDGVDWHERAKELWVKIWGSPMAAELEKPDVEGLILLIDLVHRYWIHPSNVLAAEIRQQRMAFGITPLDRRRLQWEIDRGEVAEQRTAARRNPPKQGSPRERLAALS
jgi:hypothetical protein